MRIDLINDPEVRSTSGALADILVPAFRDDPLVRGLYPTDLDYVCHFPALVTAFATTAFGSGTVDIDRSGYGAALWFPPGRSPDIAAVRERLRASLPARRFGFAGDALEILRRLRPTQPHWYLPWLGIVPEARGAGLGTALLTTGLERADREGVPIFAEATSSRGVAFYGRHGFETWARMTLPGCPEVIVMRRPVVSQSAPPTLPSL